MLAHEPFPTFAKVVGAIDWSLYTIDPVRDDLAFEVQCHEHGVIEEVGGYADLTRVHKAIQEHDAEHHAVGPWGGADELLPEGNEMPRSPKQILELAKVNGWGFGPISLVFRMNHEAPDVPPFFVCWRYSIEAGRWAFDSARDMNGFGLSVAAIREMLPLAASLGGSGD